MIDFNPLISNFLKRESFPKSVGRYYPSEAGSCVRKSWYSYNIPRQPDVEVLKVFEMGNLVHGFIVDVLKSEKNPHIKLISSEDPFQIQKEDFTISGRIDDVVVVKADNKIYVVEVKSTASLTYTLQPNESHVYQIQLYMHHKKIKDGIILYVEKNTLKTKSFAVSYDEAKLNEAIKRFELLHKHLKANTLPIPEGRMRKEMNWQCKTCPYRTECYQATPPSKELS
ncbi:MAG: PD-(D/E)XK nuclease family protein [Candidatus Woesearchaeota archaeon]